MGRNLKISSSIRFSSKSKTNLSCSSRVLFRISDKPFVIVNFLHIIWVGCNSFKDVFHSLRRIFIFIFIYKSIAYTIDRYVVLLYLFPHISKEEQARLESKTHAHHELVHINVLCLGVNAHLGKLSISRDDRGSAFSLAELQRSGSLSQEPRSH